MDCSVRVAGVNYSKTNYVMRLHRLTLSKICSLLTSPPHSKEDPRTRRRFERIEPKREYFSTCIFLLWSANNAIINSVALPHVALRRPPTAKFKHTESSIFVIATLVRLLKLQFCTLAPQHYFLQHLINGLSAFEDFYDIVASWNARIQKWFWINRTYGYP